MLDVHCVWLITFQKIDWPLPSFRVPDKTVQDKQELFASKYNNTIKRLLSTNRSRLEWEMMNNRLGNIIIGDRNLFCASYCKLDSNWYDKSEATFPDLLAPLAFSDGRSFSRSHFTLTSRAQARAKSTSPFSSIGWLCSLPTRAVVSE
jgi:hypothetical protein